MSPFSEPRVEPKLSDVAEDVKHPVEITAPPYPALFHLGFQLPHDLDLIRERFGTVKYVLLCGSPNRAALLARSFVSVWDGEAVDDSPDQIKDLCATDRYTLFQPHPAVLTSSHGIGTGSADILFHEITSLLRVAGATEFKYIRVGSCGGCATPAGTLIVSNKVVDGTGASVMRLIVLGKTREYPAYLDPVLTSQLVDFARDMCGPDKVRTGCTMCCETFYEGQARMDGAFVDYTVEDRTSFLEMCRSAGIVNFEMESLVLASFCTRANIPCAVMCAALVDRLGGGSDTPDASPAKLKEWEHLPVRVVTNFIALQLRTDQRGD